MLDNLRIALIGAGAMGEAIIAGLLRQNLVQPEQLRATEPRLQRREELSTTYGITLSEDNSEAARWSQILILAVKPQILPSILPSLHGKVPSDTLCLSIMAGIPMHTLHQGLGHTRVIRAMPNTPAQIGAGMTVWTATADVSPAQHEQAKLILGSLGAELYVDDETYLDMSTAINGSGPAYIFLMLEAMIDAGVQLGLPRPIATELVTQTMLGSVQYAQQSNLHLAQLRNAVTSPGGTTAAALSALEQGGLRATLNAAIRAAYHRSVELAGPGTKPDAG